MQDLTAEKIANAHTTSSFVSRLFAVLFPGSPAVNALLATLYISGPPNFLLALCPPDIDPSSLSIMVAFAVGGLMGDTLFHLLPEIFVGEDSHESARFILVEPNRNLLLGVAILVGFMTFVAMDKGLRIATGGEGHDHSHSRPSHHEQSHDELAAQSGPQGSSSALDVPQPDGVKSRPGVKRENGAVVNPDGNDNGAEGKQLNPSVKLGGYLNLMFVHSSLSVWEVYEG